MFWLVLYYALKGLTISSYVFIDRAAGRDPVIRSGNTLFPYASVVLIFLLLLFYSCIFWLFKKINRYKSNYTRAAIVAGWLLLVYGTNYQLIRLLPAPTVLPGLPAFTVHWLQQQIVIGLAFLALLGVAAAYFFIRERIQNELMRGKADALRVDTELRFLRAQVNPHFLFNTLNNLFSMALKEGKSNLADLISKLSGMMRYLLYESDADKVSLEKEIGYLEDYLALHGMRYAPSEVEISFRHPAPDVIATVEIAPMLFIPFLENAFKHGVAIGGRSTISMVISVSEKRLIFTCENINHSAVKKLEEEKGGIGLENVNRRLKLIYPGRHELIAGIQNEKYIVNLQIELS